MSTASRIYTLLGRDGVPYKSITPGTLGGYRRGRIYGRLDCPSALRAIAQGHYVRHRVFFADEATAIAAGYRPCGACMREKYAEWKARTRGAKPKKKSKKKEDSGEKSGRPNLKRSDESVTPVPGPPLPEIEERAA
ncbi:hypothetical protein BOTBODRAFT_28739 [Botryobasidium botryosum FD-172 SS1]|uniref:Ada DNA repair metal-binding domain-containing protein n=1 Tax=Botryobasidium botryosum (strain FD-172 SS1) TaxID=930990 RepID=A0A067MUI6_BOTB1|nr:hypothetical protein BOTBODRAFT_28739 [Botryobasidium botryosum FD-172 SS1]